MAACLRGCRGPTAQLRSAARCAGPSRVGQCGPAGGGRPPFTHNTHRTLCNTYTHDTVHFMPPTLQTIITPSRATKQGEMSRLAPLVTCHGALHITHITHGLVCGVLCVVKGNMSGVSSRDSHMCPPHCTGAGPSLFPQSTIMFLSLTRHYTRLIVDCCTSF